MKKNMKRILAALCATALCALFIASLTAAAETHTSNKPGTYDGYGLEFLMDEGSGDGHPALSETEIYADSSDTQETAADGGESHGNEISGGDVIAGVVAFAIFCAGLFATGKALKNSSLERHGN